MGFTVTYYRSSEYKKTYTCAVSRIEVMPPPEELTDEDIELAEGMMLTLYLTDGRVICVPHSLIISIE